MIVIFALLSFLLLLLPWFCAIMANILTSAIVSEVRGSVGTTTFSRNKGGAYAKLRAIPTNPSTSYQQVRRNITKNGVAAWQALTDQQRLEWQQRALFVKDKSLIKGSGTLSGYQLFMSRWMWVAWYGESEILDPDFDDPMGDLVIITATCSTSSFFLRLKNVNASSFWRIGCYLTFPVSPGVMSVNTTRMRYGPVQTSISAWKNGINIKSSYEAAFTTLAPNVGKKIFVRFLAFNWVNGIYKTSPHTSVIIQA